MERKRDYTQLSKEELIQIAEQSEKEIERLNGVLGLVFKGYANLENELKQYTIFKRDLPFDQSWSWVSKIVYTVQTAGRLVKASEITEFLRSVDLNCRYMRQSDVENNLSVHLQRAVKYKRLLSYKVSGLKAQYYGLPEWFDENDGLKPEYKVNPHFT